MAAAVHLRATCFDSSADSPCFWLQARADLVDGVPVLGLAMQLAL